jgi:hypothetical protein
VQILGTNFPVFGYAFDAASTETIQYRVPIENYGSGNLTLKLHWYSRSGSTSGAVVWSTDIEAITDGDAQSMETDAFATAQTVTTTVNATAKGPTGSSITISNLDSLATGDTIELRIQRLGANAGDTMAGDAILFAIELQYSDT